MKGKYMQQAMNQIVPIQARIFVVEINSSLFGTAADARFVAAPKYSDGSSPVVFGFATSVQQIDQAQDTASENDWTEDYKSLLKRSAVFEELQKKSV